MAKVILTSLILLLACGLAPARASEPDGPVPARTARARPPAASADEELRYWGVAIPGVPWDMRKLDRWEREVAGKRVSIVHFWYFWLEDPKRGLQPFNAVPLQRVRDHGAIPMVTWPSERMGGGKQQEDFALRHILDGTYDGYIEKWAIEAKRWGHPFFLRWGHEMNGDWFPWSETANGNRAGEFVRAWRHIHEIFGAVGAHNVTWVWCPNVDKPRSTRPSFKSLYPGDDYVDWTCLDGYNWGASRDEGWVSFSDLYKHSYDQVVALAPEKPVMIGEWGAVEQGGQKASWVADALNVQIARAFPRIKAHVWFNVPFDGVDWRIETSQASIAAWKNGIASRIYTGNQYGSLRVSPIPEP